MYVIMSTHNTDYLWGGSGWIHRGHGGWLVYSEWVAACRAAEEQLGYTVGANGWDVVKLATRVVRVARVGVDC